MNARIFNPEELGPYLEREHGGKPDTRVWRIVLAPEEIHQLRASGGKWMMPAIIGACGKSLTMGDHLEETTFWWRSDRHNGWCSTLEQAKQNVEDWLKHENI